MNNMEENVDTIRQFIRDSCLDSSIQTDVLAKPEEERKALQAKIAKENLQPVVYINPATI